MGEDEVDERMGGWVRRRDPRLSCWEEIGWPFMLVLGAVEGERVLN